MQLLIRHLYDHVFGNDMMAGWLLFTHNYNTHVLGLAIIVFYKQ